MFEVVPPKESMGTRPKKLQGLINEFSKNQYDFIQNLNEELSSDEFKELTKEEQTYFERGLNLQVDAYNKLWEFNDRF